MSNRNHWEGIYQTKAAAGRPIFAGGTALTLPSRERP